MVLSAAGQTLPVPAYLVATTGAQAALGPAYVQVCLPPPDIPTGTPGRATFGAKLYGAQLAINGVFSTVAAGTWVAFWTPYTPSVGQVNAAGTVASPATLAAGGVTLAARKSGRAGKAAVVTGRVVQGPFVRIGATVVDLRRPEGEQAEAARPRADERERQLHVQGQVGHVLPGQRDDRAGQRRAGLRRSSRPRSRRFGA